jgi:uncharacterized membrane-anchored protein YjiN (DUF445 family)
MEIASWLQSLYNANNETINELDGLFPLDADKATKVGSLLSSVLDIIEQIKSINDKIMQTELNGLSYYAQQVYQKLKESLLSDDYSYDSLVEYDVDRLKSFMQATNETIEKLLSEIEEQMKSGIFDYDIEIPSDLSDEISEFLGMYEDFKSWYGDGSIISQLSYYGPDEFDDEKINEYANIYDVLKTHYDKVRKIVKKLNLTMFVDDIKTLSQLFKDVYTPDELRKFVESYADVDVKEMDDDEYNEMVDEFYNVLQPLEEFASELILTMKNVYWFLTNHWKQHL